MDTKLPDTLAEMGRRARGAGNILAAMDTAEKNRILARAADALLERYEEIQQANTRDMELARERGMSAGMLDRLRVDRGRVLSQAKGLWQLCSLPDPVGEEIESFQRPNGLSIRKVRVPLGVVGIIYESRPNVTTDAFGLCFKAGNAVILRGGADAYQTNLAIETILRDALARHGAPVDAVQLIHDTSRAATGAFMRMNGYLDVLIPRGGSGLIRTVVENATVPVIETGAGNCHIYVDESADVDMAVSIICNAKTQRVGVCNACESLVVHQNVREALLPKLKAALDQRGVEIRADEGIRSVIDGCAPVTQEDYGTEYLDYILSACTVSCVEEAIDHINRYHTGHSDAIITRDEENARRFLAGVDSACVYVNASTRFTDGYEFGFGAEVGISTQKLHARGPMGLRELTSYKYLIRGNGQIRG